MVQPAPTVLPELDTFMTAPTRPIWFVPTIADKTAPTKTELDAGTDVSAQVVRGGIAGFMVTQANIEAGNAGSDVVPQSAGLTTMGDSSIKFYCAPTGPDDDVRSLLTFNLKGFIVFPTEGNEAGGHMDVWPVRVKRPMLPQDTDALAQVEIPFAITSLPVTGIAIPTS